MDAARRKIYPLQGCPTSTSTDTLQRKPHTGRFKTWIYVVDTKRRKEAY